MRSSLAALSVIALAACQPAADDPADGASGSEDISQTPASAPPSGDVVAGDEPPSAEAPASLVGEYRVAGIDGTEVGGGIGIGLSITGSEIYYEPRCAGFDWTYTYDGGVLATERPADRPVCEIAVHPEMQRLATALDVVTRAERTPSNGIELTGGGHSVTLYSQ